MKKFLVVLAVCGLVLMAFSATASAAKKSRPFQGYMVGQVTFTPTQPGEENPSPWGLWTNSNVSGDVSHLGASVLTARHPTPGGTEIAGGKMKIVAANGNELWITYTGYAPLPTPGVTDVFPVDLDITITGGTGRFAAASGGGDMTAWVKFLGYDVFVWPATFVWSGCTIRY
jgi:hypothetical protein